ncbi:unnamed protein product, partial [Ceratitis capitata]
GQKFIPFTNCGTFFTVVFTWKNLVSEQVLFIAIIVKNLAILRFTVQKTLANCCGDGNANCSGSPIYVSKGNGSKKASSNIPASQPHVEGQAKAAETK